MTPEERLGHHGLSYDLIRRAKGAPLHVSFPRAYGGAAGARVGFSSFKTDWETRIQLLFDWDDGFHRGNWDRSPFRQWGRLIHQRLKEADLDVAARRFKRKLRQYGVEYIKVLPKYEADKIY